MTTLVEIQETREQKINNAEKALEESFYILESNLKRALAEVKARHEEFRKERMLHEVFNHEDQVTVDYSHITYLTLEEETNQQILRQVEEIHHWNNF